MANHYEISSTLSWIITFALVIFVLLSGKRSRLVSAFSFYTLSISAWSFGWSRMVMADNLSGGLFWARALHIGATFIPVSFFRFSLALQPEEQSTKWRFAIRLGYVLTLFFILFCFSDLFVPQTADVSGIPYYPQPGPLYIPFLTFFVIYVLLSFWTLMKTYRESSGHKKTQMWYVFLGYAIGYVGGPQAFMPVFGFHMWPYTFYAVTIGMLVLTYAILTQRLLDIVVLTRDAVAQILSLAISIFPFIISAFLAKQLWSWPNFALNNGPGPLLCAVFNFSLALTMFTVYQNVHARRLSALFVLLGIWNATALFLCIPETVLSVWIYRFGYGIACFVTLAWFLYWKGYFFDKEISGGRASTWFSISAFVMLPIASVSPWVLKSLEFHTQKLQTATVIPGSAHWVFAFWFLLMVTVAGYWPSFSLLKLRGKKKFIASFWILGSFIFGFAAAITYFLFVEIQFPWYWYPILEFFLCFFLISSLVWRLSLEESASQILLTQKFISLGLFTLAVPFLVGPMYAQDTKWMIFSSGILFVGSIGFVMWRIRDPIRDWVDQTFLFRGQFGHLAKAMEFAMQGRDLNSLGEALPQIARKLLDITPYRSCTIGIMFDDQFKRTMFRSTCLRLSGGELIPARQWNEPLVQAFLQMARNNDGICLREELKETPPAIKELDPIMFEAVAPLTANGKTEGFIVIGPKEGKLTTFHGEDINILKELAQSISQQLGPSVELNKFRSIVNTTLHDAIGHDIGTMADEIEFELEEESKEGYTDILKESLARFRKIAEVLMGLRAHAQREFEKGIVLEFGPLDMGALLKRICETHKIVGEKKGLEIRLNVSDSIPKPRLDPSLVERCVGNLITNAIKYTKNGYIEVSTEVEIGFLIVCVKDTGVGMSQEASRRIFEQGYRVPGEAATMAEGTGVGLSNVKDIMTALGGRIEVRSELGRGSEFKLYFPLLSLSGDPRKNS